jgi:hypothetical protein
MKVTPLDVTRHYTVRASVIRNTITHTHTRTSPPFLTNVRTLNSEENCTYAKAPTYKGTTKQVGIKLNAFLTWGLNGSEMSVSRSDCFTSGVDSVLIRS